MTIYAGELFLYQVRQYWEDGHFWSSGVDDKTPTGKLDVKSFQLRPDGRAVIDLLIDISGIKLETRIGATVVGQQVVATFSVLQKQRKLLFSMELTLVTHSDYVQITGRLRANDYAPMHIEGEIEVVSDRGHR